MRALIGLPMLACPFDDDFGTLLIARIPPLISLPGKVADRRFFVGSVDRGGGFANRAGLQEFLTLGSPISNQPAHADEGKIVAPCASPGCQSLGLQPEKLGRLLFIEQLWKI
jgi:hypothetical protein